VAGCPSGLVVDLLIRIAIIATTIPRIAPQHMRSIRVTAQHWKDRPMTWIDWLIALCPLLIVAYIGFCAQKYVKSVADFLTAGRVANRYVVAVAQGEAQWGIVAMLGWFQIYYHNGFAWGEWGCLTTPLSIFLVLTGYCYYRYRETRAMTMGQFFEIRYNKSFRIYAAFLQSISGILGYAIFPAIGARLFIYYCQLPLHIEIFGWEFPTFGLVMAALLSVAVLIVTLGGQITVMVTDCVQGLLSYPLYLIIIGFVFFKLSFFDQVAPTLLDREPGKSMLNPFDTFELRNFNLFFVIVGVFSLVINRMTSSGQQGYNAAAVTPHEQKMGQVLGMWRGMIMTLMFLMIGITAYVFLNHADFAGPAREVRNELAQKVLLDVAGDEQFDAIRKETGDYMATGEIGPALQERLDRVKREEEAGKTDQAAETSADVAAKDELEKQLGPDPEAVVEIVKTALKSEDKAMPQTFEAVFEQFRVPVAFRKVLPVGLTGILCALMLFLLISTDTTYLHSWGSILVQDLILPFRKEPFTPRQQLKLLRIMITLVAIFAFFFSLYFAQMDFIVMFLTIIGAIYLGGAGPCVVGGLYWKRGTTLAAFTALTSGAILSVATVLLQKYWASGIYPWLVSRGWVDSVSWFFETITKPFHPIIVWEVTPDKFPINSQEMYFITMITSVSLYVVLSLLSRKEPFNLERMLHRGKYHVEGEVIEKPKLTFKSGFQQFLGIDSRYTRGDKAIAWSVFLYYTVWMFGSFLFMVIWNWISPWKTESWPKWFFFRGISIGFVLGTITAVWFTIGGTLGLRDMFKRLKAKEANIRDDGRVVDHVSAEDLDRIEKMEQDAES
jgi:Na+/proline symporter